MNRHARQDKVDKIMSHAQEAASKRDQRFFMHIRKLAPKMPEFSLEQLSDSPWTPAKQQTHMQVDLPDLCL